jgi:hypothetical protein
MSSLSNFDHKMAVVRWSNETKRRFSWPEMDLSTTQGHIWIQPPDKWSFGVNWHLQLHDRIVPLYSDGRRSAKGSISCITRVRVGVEYEAHWTIPPGSSYAKVYKISNGFAKRFVVSLGQSTIRHNEGGQCLVAASTTKIRSPPTTMTSLSFNFYDGRDNAISS